MELLPRVIRDAAQRLFGPDFEIRETLLPLDAPQERRRDRRVSAALDTVANECNLLFIHADGQGDPERARRERIDPATNAARVHPAVHTVPCVPVRETEAWLLADAGAFDRVFGRETRAELPPDPESLGDPKASFCAVLAAIGSAISPPSDLLPRFGQEIALQSLRRLSAFQRLDEDLEAALQAVAEHPSD